MWRILQHPAILILFCFSISGSAVSYRGGASDAHPHMFLEFLLDASAGSFDHHHGGSPDENDQHASAEHTHALDDHSQHTHARAAQPLAASADSFSPTVSAFVIGDVGQLALLVPQPNRPQIGDLASRVDSSIAPLSGRTHPPIAPPPR